MRFVPLLLAVTLTLVPLAGGQPPGAEEAPDPPPPAFEPPAPFWTWKNTLAWPDDPAHLVEVQETPAIDMDSGHLALALPPIGGNGSMTATVFLYEAPFQGPPLGVLPPFSVFDDHPGGAMGVAVSGDAVMIGLAGGSPGSGHATIFEYARPTLDAFEVVAEFESPPDAKDFGRAVAFDEAGAVIGAEGAVYLYGPRAEGYPLQNKILGGPGFGHDVDLSSHAIVVGDPVANEIQIIGRHGDVLSVHQGDHVERLGTDVKIQDTGPDTATAVATAIQSFETEERHTILVFTLEGGIWSDRGVLHTDAVEGPPAVALDGDVAVQPVSSTLHLVSSLAPMPDADEGPPWVHKDDMQAQVQVSNRFGHDAAADDGWLAVADGAGTVHLFQRGAGRDAPPAPPEPCPPPLPPPIATNEPESDLLPMPVECQPEPIADIPVPDDGRRVPPLPPPPPRNASAPGLPEVDLPVARPTAAFDLAPVDVTLRVEPRVPTQVAPSPQVQLTYLIDEAVTISETLEVSPEPLPALPPVPGEPIIPDATTYLHIEVHDIQRDEASDHEKPLDQTVLIQINYDDEDVPEGVAEKDLGLHFFDGQDWVDLSGVGPSDVVPATTPEGDLRVYGAGVDTETNTVWARVDHTSTYALGLSRSTVAPTAGSDVPWTLIGALAITAAFVWTASAVIAARKARPMDEGEPASVLEAPAVAIAPRPETESPGSGSR